MIVKYYYGCMIQGVLANTVLLNSSNTKDALRYFKDNLSEALTEQKITLTEDNICFVRKKTVNIF